MRVALITGLFAAVIGICNAVGDAGSGSWTTSGDAFYESNEYGYGLTATPYGDRFVYVASKYLLAKADRAIRS